MHTYQVKGGDDHYHLGHQECYSYHLYPLIFASNF